MSDSSGCSSDSLSAVDSLLLDGELEEGRVPGDRDGDNYLLKEPNGGGGGAATDDSDFHIEDAELIFKDLDTGPY